MTSDLFTTPLITVVIPTYNHALYLRRAIKSVINQTYKNWELLVIDNHSTDETDIILSEFSNLPMAVFKVNNRGSIAISRNIGSAHAQGEWIAFLDSDDYWTDDKLQVCSTYFTPDVDLIYHDLKIFDESLKLQKNKKTKSRQLKSPVTIDLLLKGNPIATSSVLVRKTTLDAVGGMNEAPQLIGTEDYNTWLRISRQTERFKYVAEALGSYRLHEANISNVKAYAPPRAAIADFLGILSEKQHKKLEFTFLYIGARLNYLSGRHSEARMSLEKVIRSKHFRYALKALWMLSAGFLNTKVEKLRKTRRSKI
jgi:glycosyltransferase involved in cell wall biosynthesis